MNCPACGTVVTSEDKFCPSCGKPAGSPACPKCNYAVTSQARFCTKCGYNLKGVSETKTPSKAERTTPKPGIASELKDLSQGEVVTRDTGFFPITFQKSWASSTNGKLYLTSRRLVFKAVLLQGIGGVYVPAAGGVFIPNPRDAEKMKEYFAIPLEGITAVESGWANLTISTGGQKYKFGGMVRPKEWAEAVNQAIGGL